MPSGQIFIKAEMLRVVITGEIAIVGVRPEMVSKDRRER
jgi:hypothetical protein